MNFIQTSRKKTENSNNEAPTLTQRFFFSVLDRWPDFYILIIIPTAHDAEATNDPVPELRTVLTSFQLNAFQIKRKAFSHQIPGTGTWLDPYLSETERARSDVSAAVRITSKLEGGQEHDNACRLGQIAKHLTITTLPQEGEEMLQQLKCCSETRNTTRCETFTRNTSLLYRHHVWEMMKLTECFMSMLCAKISSNAAQSLQIPQTHLNPSCFFIGCRYFCPN